MEENQVDCDQVKTCVQRLIWDVEQLIQREVKSDKRLIERDLKFDQRIGRIEKFITQVKWAAYGILGTLVAYAIGIIEMVKRLMS